MARPFSTNFAETYAPANLTDGLNGFIVTEDGSPYVLGAVVPGEETAENRRLYAIDSSGDVIAASKRQGKPYVAGATDVEIFQYGGTGQSEWILVYADSAIAAGDPVTRLVTGLPTGFVVGQAVGEPSLAGVHPARVMGVAQHNIAAGNYGWILRKGKGRVQVDGTSTLGAGAILDASVAGHVSDAGAITDEVLGFFLEAVTDAVGLVWLDCRG
ncbi:MAG: hypothetical protein ACYTFV_00870 [Planctomycetota bacterium]